MTLENANGLVQRLDAEVSETGSATRDTAQDLQKILARADETLSRLENTIAGTEEAQFQAMRTMADMSRALTSMRNLVEFIEMHPEAFIAGKPKESK